MDGDGLQAAANVMKLSNVSPLEIKPAVIIVKRKKNSRLASVEKYFKITSDYAFCQIDNCNIKLMSAFRQNLRRHIVNFHKQVAIDNYWLIPTLGDPPYNVKPRGIKLAKSFDEKNLKPVVNDDDDEDDKPSSKIELSSMDSYISSSKARLKAECESDQDEIEELEEE